MIFVFRNSTLENLFPKEKYVLGEYESPLANETYENYLWMNFLPPLPSKQALLLEISKLKRNLDISIVTAKEKKISILGLFLPEIYLSLNEKDEVEKEIYNFNQHVIQLSKDNFNVSFINPDTFKKTLGNNYFSSKYFFSIGAVISPSVMNNFSLWLDHFERNSFSTRKKLLIIDLDNTLWGGILGEDGPEGIKTDSSSYPGNVFSYMQHKLKDLSSNGVLLAISSKNNYSDVEEVFKKNKFLNISLNDFTAVKTNWKEKSENIKEIISEVNLSEDACVFLDDNPLERDLVKNSLPNISVPDFPEKIYEIPSFLEKTFHYFFSSEKILDEDLLKKTQYEIRDKAEKAKIEFSSKEEFLKSLELEGKILSSIDSIIPRLSQMTQKTNQFNFTTKRFSEEDISKLISSGEIIYPLQVKDIYGDHGITGLIIVSRKNEKEAELINFLMSCRILGRDIEQSFLEWCIFDLKKMGFEKLSGKFIPTKKNKLARDFLKNFKIFGKNLKNSEINENTTIFELNMENLSDKKIDKKFIKISKMS